MGLWGEAKPSLSLVSVAPGSPEVRRVSFPIHMTLITLSQGPVVWSAADALLMLCLWHPCPLTVPVPGPCLTTAPQEGGWRGGGGEGR